MAGIVVVACEPIGAAGTGLATLAAAAAAALPEAPPPPPPKLEGVLVIMLDLPGG